MTTLKSLETAVPISDFMTGAAASIKADATAQAAPGAGGIQVAGYDRTNALQRHIEVNQNGAVIIGNVGGDAETANADADADFVSTMIGLLTNARNGYLQDGGNWRRWTGSTPNSTEGISSSSGAYLAPWTISVAAGRDSGGNTVRIAESRASSAAQSPSLYRILVDSAIRFCDQTSGNWTLVEGATISSVSGTATSVRGAYAGALMIKEDKENSVLRTVETHRGSRTATTNPTALQVVGSLDTRGLIKSRLHVVFTAADTARIQVSFDNSNWITLEDIGGTPNAFAPTTAILLSQIEGWRYIRVLAVAGFTGTATVTFSTQGA